MRGEIDCTHRPRRVGSVFMRGDISRRSAVATAACCFTPQVGHAFLPSSPPFSPRLDANSLTPLSTYDVPSVSSDLRYPRWLQGTWRVSNTITRFSMPLGSAFVDSFTRATAQEDVDAAQTLSYLLKFDETLLPSESDPELCVAQDRRFNAVEETGAFLSGEGLVVADGSYQVNEQHPHGRIDLVVRDPDAIGDSRAAASAARQDSTTTRIELSIEWAAWDAAASGGAFVTSELAVQRVMLPPDQYFSESAVDTSFLEIITRFEKPQRIMRAGGANNSHRRPTTVVRARNRLVQYLSLPGIDTLDKGATKRSRGLERLAAGRAVSFFDYDWVMELVEPDGRSLNLGSPLRA